MELRDLRSFVAVAQHRNFSRAAEQLHLSQPALSEQIRKLEDELGTPLFERTSRGALLTAAGEAFLPRAHSVLEEAEAALDAVVLVARGLAGRLTIGFVDTAAIGILPPLIRAFRTHHPAVRLILRELGTRAQLEAVENGEIDVGILTGPVRHDRIAGRRLAVERLVVAVPESHRLADAPVIRVADLREDDFITHAAERGAPLYEETLRLCHAAGFEPRIVQRANEIATICAMVAAGLGVAIVPASITAIGLAGVVYVGTDASDARLERWAVWREHAPRAVVRAFVDSLPSA